MLKEIKEDGSFEVIYELGFKNIYNLYDCFICSFSFNYFQHGKVRCYLI